jgi:hypothetical protein
MMKSYQIKMLQMEEQKKREEDERLAKERDRRGRYMTE